MYATIHFFFVQHSKTWTKRTTYEQILTIFSVLSIIYVFFFGPEDVEEDSIADIMYWVFTGIGLIMMYSMAHFLFIQHGKNWTQRNKYQKIVTIVAIIGTLLLYIGVMTPQ